MTSLPLDRAQWFATHVQTHEPLLRGWLAARFPQLPDRDDIVQEAFFRLLRLPDTSAIENPKAFLFTTARNLALNALRQQQNAHPEGLGEIDPSRVLDERSDTPESVARRQEMELLTEALHTLPARCREVFVLRRLHGLSQKETAIRLGISEKTVENQCVLALRKCMEFFRARERAAVRRIATLGPASPAPLGHPEVRHA